MKRTHRGKRLLALLLVFCMLFGTVSMALADETASEKTITESVEAEDRPEEPDTAEIVEENIEETEEETEKAEETTVETAEETAAAEETTAEAEETTAEATEETVEAEETTAGETVAETAEAEETIEETEAEVQVLDTEYFGEIAFLIKTSEGDPVSVELSEATAWEKCQPIFDALQISRDTEDMILGDVIVQAEEEENTSERDKARTYEACFQKPENFTEVQVFVMEDDEAVPVRTATSKEERFGESEGGTDAETATVRFQMEGNGIFILEFQGYIPEEERNHGCIVSEEFLFDEEELLTETGEEELSRTGEAKLPGYYSSVEEGYVPAVRNQASLGTCTSHAITATAEINMIRNGYADADTTDYSEAALCYYHYHTVPDPLGLVSRDETKKTDAKGFKNGANDRMEALGLAGWKGMTDEENAPYSWLEYGNLNEVDPQLAAGGTDLCYNSNSAILVGSSYISMREQNQIKQTVMNEGAVSIYFSITGTYLRNLNGQYYYYVDQYTSDLANSLHEVAIVGWDDSVSSSCFKADPGVDGAWLVRNSWGANWGDQGYFWLSYVDKSTGSQAVALKFVPAETYDHNYHYDGTGNPGSNGLAVGGKAGNIFQVSGTGEQKLSAVNVEMYIANASVDIAVYASDEPMNDPEDGSIVAELSETTTFIGNYTFPLEQEIILQPGQYFSVVIKNTSDKYIYISCDGSTTGGWYSTADYTEKGQSFTFNTSGTAAVWQDLDEQNTHRGRTWRIHAFTNDCEDSVAPESIVFGESSFRIREGQTERIQYTVYPENAGLAVPVWTSSDPTVATVSLDGTVTGISAGTCTVTARLSEEIFAEAQITVFEVFKIRFLTDRGKPVPGDQFLETGEKAEKPEDPVKSGYIFRGWFIDVKLETAWDPDQAVTKDLTVRAKWELNNTKHALSVEKGNGKVTIPNGGWAKYLTDSGCDERITHMVIAQGSAEAPVSAEGALIYQRVLAGDSSVICYDILTEEDRTLYLIFNSKDGKLHAPNGPLFSYLSDLKEIRGLQLFDTQGVNNFSAMFNGCSALTELDLSGFSTAAGNNMSSMFSGCKSLKKLDLSSFSTPNVVSMNGMFYGCTSLEELDIRGFSSAKLKSNTYLTAGCNSLSKVTIGNDFHPAGEWLPGATAERIRILGSKIDGNWHLHDEPYTFYSPAQMCSAPAGTYYAVPFLFSITYRNSETDEIYATEKVKYGEKACGPAYCMEGKVLRGWYESPDGTGDAWNPETAVITKDLTLYAIWDTAEGKVSFNTPNGTETLRNGVSWYTTSLPATMKTAFTKVIFWNISLKGNVTEGHLIDSWNAAEDGSVRCVAVSDKKENILLIVFGGRTEDGKVHALSGFGFNYYSASAAPFLRVRSIEGLEQLDVSATYYLSGMFSELRNLQEVDISGLDTANMVSCAGMFNNCISLKKIKFGKFNTEKVTTMQQMFNNCYQLTELDLSGFSSKRLQVCTNMMAECRCLAKVVLGSDFHPASAYLPGKTVLRERMLGEQIDGRWHLQSYPYTAYTPEEMTEAPAGVYHAVPVTFTVMWKDSETGEILEKRKVIHDEKITEPVYFAEGKHLTGWYRDSTGAGDPWDYEENTVSGDLILYAFWEADEGEVSFHIPEGEAVLKKNADWYTEEIPQNLSASFTAISLLNASDREIHLQGTLSGAWKASADGSAYCVAIRKAGKDFLYLAYHGKETAALLKADPSGFCFFSADKKLDEVEEITNLDLLDVANAVSLADCFRGMKALQGVDLSGFTSEGLKNCTGMFDGCDRLAWIKLGSGFHPEEAYLPGQTAGRLQALGRKVDGKWHRHDGDFDSLTPGEMCNATEGIWYAYPRVFTVRLITAAATGTTELRTVEVEAGTLFDPEEPEREGYDFTGWFYGSGSTKKKWNPETDRVRSDLTLTAEWKEHPAEEEPPEEEPPEEEPPEEEPPEEEPPEEEPSEEEPAEEEPSEEEPAENEDPKDDKKPSEDKKPADRKKTSGNGTSSGASGGTASAKSAVAGVTYSEFWFIGADGKWRVKNGQQIPVTTAWLCDDAVTENGQNVWYLLNTDGSMLEAPLVQDNTGHYYSLETAHNGFFGSLRYKNGTYDGIYMEFSQKHDGSFGAVTNPEAIKALTEKYGVIHFGVDNSSCVYTASFR